MDQAWSGIVGGVMVAAILGIWATVRKALSKRYKSPVVAIGEKIDALAENISDLAGGVNRLLLGHIVVCECVETVLINQKEGKCNGTTEASLSKIAKEKEAHNTYIVGRG